MYTQRVEVEKNYQGDIAALHTLGFDAAKFDNCGSMKNLTKYAELMQATGKNYTVENCHWGHCWDQDGDPDASVSPTIVPAETRSDALGKEVCVASISSARIVRTGLPDEDVVSV